MNQNRAMVAAAAACGGVAVGYALSRAYARRELSCVLRSNGGLASTQQQRSLITCLTHSGHGYLFRHWAPAGVNDAAKQRVLHVAAAAIEQAIQQPAVEHARLDAIQAPTAERRPKQLSTHNDVRSDPYYWLRDDERKEPAVIAHLKAETAYAEAALADTEALQDALYKELRGRIQEADQSAPQRHGPYFYYSRTVEGGQYRINCRRPVPPNMGTPSENNDMESSLREEVLLDENAQAQKHSFYMVRGVEVSPDHSRLAYAVDTVGGEKFTLHVLDPATGKKLLTPAIEDTAGSIVWANDNDTLFYVTKDKLDRPYKVWRYRVGSGAKEHDLVFHEQDDSFYVGIGRERSDKMLMIESGSAVTSETRFLDADKPLDGWTVIRPRENEVEYSAEHRGDHFFITLRDEAHPNSQLLVAPVSNPSDTKVLLEHREDVKLENVVVARDYLTIFERCNGQRSAIVYQLPKDGAMPLELTDGKKLEFDEEVYDIGPGSQGDFDSPILRLSYTSLTTPSTTMDHNLATHNRQGPCALNGAWCASPSSCDM